MLVLLRFTRIIFVFSLKTKHLHLHFLRFLHFAFAFVASFVRWLGGHVVHVACRKAPIVSLSQKNPSLRRFLLKNGLDWSTFASWCFLVSAALWNAWAAQHKAQDASANTDQWHRLTPSNHTFSFAFSTFHWDIEAFGLEMATKCSQLEPFAESWAASLGNGARK